MIVKRFTGNLGGYDWEFDLTFYDGKYQDQKFAEVQVSVNAERNMTVLQSNGYI